jgi:hypothetical protein
MDWYELEAKGSAQALTHRRAKGIYAYLAGKSGIGSQRLVFGKARGKLSNLERAADGDGLVVRIINLE